MAKNYKLHQFFCLQCGRENVPLFRKQGHKHERYHRKKLYCPYCKIEINHIECKDEEEVYNFKLNFENGVYRDEAEESLVALRDSRLG